MKPFELVQTPWGRTAIYTLGDCISETIRGQQFWDGGLLTPFYDKWARPDTTAIDIGAFNGQSSLYLAKLCNRVISVEPIHWELCTQTFDANRELFDKIDLVSGAAYDRWGYMEFAHQIYQQQQVQGLDPHEIGNPGGVALVPVKEDLVVGGPGRIRCYQLDEFIRPNEEVCLIKSDAQGSDLRALVGLTETITRCRPAILFEFEDHLAKLHGDDWKTIEDFFEPMGYDLEEQTSIGYARNYVAVPR